MGIKRHYVLRYGSDQGWIDDQAMKHLLHQFERYSTVHLSLSVKAMTWKDRLLHLYKWATKTVSTSYAMEEFKYRKKCKHPRYIRALARHGRKQ